MRPTLSDLPRLLGIGSPMTATAGRDRTEGLTRELIDALGELVQEMRRGREGKSGPLADEAALPHPGQRAETRASRVPPEALQAARRSAAVPRFSQGGTAPWVQTLEALKQFIR
jgi:hypothetical protein